MNVNSVEGVKGLLAMNQWLLTIALRSGKMQEVSDLLVQRAMLKDDLIKLLEVK